LKGWFVIGRSITSTALPGPTSPGLTVPGTHRPASANLPGSERFALGETNPFAVAKAELEARQPRLAHVKHGSSDRQSSTTRA
jgi:hypothetical protein